MAAPPDFDDESLDTPYVRWMLREMERRELYSRPRRRRLRLPGFVWVLLAVALVVAGVGVHARPVPRPAAAVGYRFLSLQPHSSDPVGYDPCQPIPVLFNPSGGPHRTRAALVQAIDDVRVASGFDVRLAGTTDRAPTFTSGYRGVVVGFADTQGRSDLTGDVAAEGGSAFTQSPGFGRLYYDHGMIVLRSSTFRRLSPGAMRAIIEHEFGHVLGLAHVQDPTQLMSPTNVGQRSFGSGDLAGLRILRHQPCGVRSGLS